MTETTSKNFQQWVGDGETTVFSPSNVTVQDQSHLAVYIGDSLQTIVTDYTVVIVSGVATVTFLSVPEIGVRVTVVRQEPLEQNTDLTTINTFRAQGFEGALDSIVRQIYRVWHRLSRSLTLPDSNVDGLGQFDARSNRVGNVGDPTADQDVVTKAFAEGRYALQSASAGDMFKATYDPDADGKVISAVNADIAPWSGLTGIPASFTPATHTHTATDVDDFNTAADTRIASSAQDVSIWEAGTGITEGAVSPAKVAAAIAALAPGGGGGGSGDMSKSVYDTDEDGKVNSAVNADVAPWSGLTNVPASFTPSSHNHTASEITDFNTSADARITASAQAEAAWIAGTATTASAVSPAHVKAAIDALGGGGSFTPVAIETDSDITGTSYDLSGLSTDHDKFLIFCSGVQPSVDNSDLEILFTDDDFTSVETTGYIGRDSNLISLIGNTNTWDASAANAVTCTIHLQRLTGTKILCTTIMHETGNTGFATVTLFDSGTSINGIRLQPDSGTIIGTALLSAWKI